MNRLIVPAPPRVRSVRGAQLADIPKAAGADAAGDKVVVRLLKYIPAEVISGYMTLGGLLQAADHASPLYFLASWFLVALGTVVTPLYLIRVGRPKGLQWLHIPISTVSFMLWAYALGGPFESVQIIAGVPYEKWFATFVAGAYTWAIALVWSPAES